MYAQLQGQTSNPAGIRTQFRTKAEPNAQKGPAFAGISLREACVDVHLRAQMLANSTSTFLSTSSCICLYLHMAG